MTNSCLIRKFSSRAFNSSLARSSSRAISIFLLCTSSIFARCSISFSCLSLASAIVALREAMSPSSCTLFSRKDRDEFREDEREDLRLDLSEILLVLVDREIVELLESCSCCKKFIRSLTILRASLFSRETTSNSSYKRFLSSSSSITASSASCDRDNCVIFLSSSSHPAVSNAMSFRVTRVE